MLAFLGVSKPGDIKLQVRSGMMNGAIRFFREIRWFEVTDRKVNQPWGQTRYFTPALNSLVVGLFESSHDPDGLTMTQSQLPLHFEDVAPEVAARAILAWADYAEAGEGAAIVSYDEGARWLVYLPAIFTFAIEIV